jgi:hypothetical protein
MNNTLSRSNSWFLVATLGFASFAASARSAEVPVKASGLPPEIRQNLVLHFDFDKEPVGGRTPDQTGNGNEGLTVNVEFVKNGHQGGAAQFGLNDSYITVTNKDAINPRRLTLAAWIKTSHKDRVWRRIFDKGTGKGYVLTMCGEFTGKNYQGQVAIEPGKTWSLSDIEVADGRWHHVVGTFNGAEARVYVDGWPVGTPGRWAGEIPSTAYDLTIGANRSNPDGAAGEIGASFNGLMDDVMMFNRALTANEIQVLFKSQGGVLGSKPAQPGQPAPGAGAAGKPAPAERLKQVKQLFDQGLISKEDYDKKVKEIVDSL